MQRCIVNFINWPIFNLSLFVNGFLSSTVSKVNVIFIKVELNSSIMLRIFCYNVKLFFAI